jgi:hypothetical protein
MKSVTLSSGLGQFIAVAAPIGALLITLFIVYPAWGRYGDVQKKIARQRKELKQLQAAPLPPGDPVLAAADDVPGEPSRFLGEIAALAGKSQCEVRGFETQGDSKAGRSIRPIRSKITVAGRYPNVRAFLAEIHKATRLYVVTDVSLRTGAGGGPGQTEATVGIERYVAPVTLVAASAQPGG